MIRYDYFTLQPPTPPRLSRLLPPAINIDFYTDTPSYCFRHMSWPPFQPPHAFAFATEESFSAASFFSLIFRAATPRYADEALPLRCRRAAAFDSFRRGPLALYY
jgi:hypothetical protein